MSLRAGGSYVGRVFGILGFVREDSWDFRRGGILGFVGDFGVEADFWESDFLSFCLYFNFKLFLFSV